MAKFHSDCTFWLKTTFELLYFVQAGQAGYGPNLTVTMDQYNTI